ncbi:common central domain of tyrosinase-domain-containing protein [Cryomyces antarcticus]
MIFPRTMGSVLSALSVFPLLIDNISSTPVTSNLRRHVVEELIPLQARQASTFSITGVQDWGVQPRLEIRQLQKNADQWNLYLLGLKRMQEVDHNNKLSYYQIAGIHGRPYIAWDGVQAATNAGGGYCAHVSNLFPTWHRPYLALYEQVLYSNIISVVNEFPTGAQRQRYASAAITFRAPYWDWAAAPPAGQSVYPASLSDPTVQVTMPNGTTTIKNPLFAYTFNPLVPQDMFYNPFASWVETKRYPTSWDVAATSQNNLVAQQLDNSRLSFRDRLYNLFTAYSNYTEFSNEAWIPDGNPGNLDSLESLHDAIHSLTGSSGHMSYLDYAAFDPIFWLHHTMIDRCFALWQALYPNSFIEPEAQVEGTFTYVPGTVKDDQSPLTPFHTDATGDMWNSETARSVTTFGYTYPELAGGNNTNSSIKAAVNSLYGSTAGSTGLSSKAKRNLIDREEAVDPVQTTVAQAVTSDGKRRQYLANIKAQKFGLDGSYFVHIFIGDFNPSPASWSFEPNLVGTHGVFANLGTSTSDGCQRCKEHQDSGLQVTGVVPLTTTLVDKISKGDLPSLDPNDVAPYLTKNLHWRITMMNDTEVPRNAVPDLAVSVVSAQVKPASSHNDFPQWGDFTVLAGITDGRPGGHNVGDLC